MADTIEAAVENNRQNDVGSYLGMTIAIASWAMLFATLFLSYFVLRGKQPMWPPSGVPVLPTWLPLVNTVVILASSRLLQLAIHSYRRDEMSAYRSRLFLTIGMGFLFMGLQILLWGPGFEFWSSREFRDSRLGLLRHDMVPRRSYCGRNRSLDSPCDKARRKTFQTGGSGSRPINCLLLAFSGNHMDCDLCFDLHILTRLFIFLKEIG